MRAGGRTGVPYTPKKQTLIEVPEQENIVVEEEEKVEVKVLNEVKKDSAPTKKYKSTSKSKKFFEGKEDSGS